MNANHPRSKNPDVGAVLQVLIERELRRRNGETRRAILDELIAQFTDGETLKSDVVATLNSAIARLANSSGVEQGMAREMLFRLRSSVFKI